MKNVKLTIAKTCLLALLGVSHFNVGWTKSVDDKVKGWIEDSSEALKKGVDKLGDDFAAIQQYLNNYHWKGLIEKEAASGPATLKHLKLNDHDTAVVVKPGEEIEAEVECHLDSEQCSIFGVYRIVVGLKGEDAQAVIGNELGLVAGKSNEKFTLKAPDEAGMYQIRFRVVNALFKDKALNSWKDEHGNEPDGTTTIGVVIVK
jgi:hypothetical protein